MIISMDPSTNKQFDISGEIQRVQNISYLGCTLNENWDYSREIPIRIEKTRSVFYQMKNVLRNLCLNLQIRLQIPRC